jgi:hypothetical protein
MVDNGFLFLGPWENSVFKSNKTSSHEVHSHCFEFFVSSVAVVSQMVRMKSLTVFEGLKRTVLDVHEFVQKSARYFERFSRGAVWRQPGAKTEL